MRTRTALVIGLLVSLLAACATNVAGRRQLMLVSESSAIAQSRQAYVQTMSKLKSQGKLVDDPRIVNRVNTITGRLIAQAIRYRPETQGWEWSVEVIDRRG